MSSGRLKEVSIRLIKPTHPEIRVEKFLELANNWLPEYEYGDIQSDFVEVFDEGIAQYSLADSDSHHKFYAAVVLGKPSLKCRLVSTEVEDVLEDVGNRFHFVQYPNGSLGDNSQRLLAKLKEILGAKGYKFAE